MVHANPESLWSYPDPDTTTTINLNQDKGLSAGDTIDSYLQNNMADNTRVEIEPGTYNWAGDPDTFDGEYNDCEVVGTGDPGEGNVELALENEGVDPYGKLECSSGTLRFKNITLTGRVTWDNTKFRIEAIGEDAECVLEHHFMPDGQMPEGSGDTNGIYAGSQEHVGTLRLLWCHVEGFGDNGAYVDGYAGSGLGQVIIVGGLYKDNNISNIRVGNDDSVVYRAISDHSGSLQIPDGREPNRRGIRIRQPGTGIHVHDCDAYQAVSSWNPVEIHDEAEGGTGELDDLRIYTESDWVAIREKQNGAEGYTGGDIDISGPGDHTVEGITVDDLCQGSSCDMAKNGFDDAWFNLSGSGGGGGGGGGGTTDDTDVWTRRYSPYIEDWDTNDPLALWEEGTRGSGKTAFSITDSFNVNGSSALQIAGDSPQFGYIAAPGGSDFYNLPNAEDDFEFWFYATGAAASSGFRVGFASSRTDPFSGYYRLQIENQELEIERFEDGNSVETFANVTYNYSLDGWCRVEVQQDGEGFRVLGYDTDGTKLADHRVDDTTYGGDGMVIGVVGQNAHTHYIDAIKNLQAKPDERVDNFDDENLDEYTVQSGTSGQWAIDSTRASEASASVKWTHTSDGTTSTITSQTGLPNYPEVGDTFGFSFYTFGNSIGKMLFGVEDGSPGNRWEVEFDKTASPSQVRLNNAKATASDSKSVDFTFESDIWIDVFVEWRDADTLQVDVVGDDVFTTFLYEDTSGNTPSGTGIGWSATADTDTEARWNFDEAYVSGTLIGGGSILTSSGVRQTTTETAYDTRGGV